MRVTTSRRRGVSAPTRRPSPARRTALALAGAGLIATAAVTAVPATAAPEKPRRADLQVAKLGAPPAKVKYGSSFGIGAVVGNSGRAAAAASSLRVLLSRDKSADPGDIVGATVRVKKVPARKSATVNTRVQVPADARGRYWVIACADAARKVRESSETNNCQVAKTPLEIDTSIAARLTGTLDFVDAGATDDGAGRTETWRRTSRVVVDIDVSGDPATRTEFGDAGSTYDQTGLRTLRDWTPNCLVETVRSEEGEGSMSDYQAEISGHFRKVDLSGVSLGLHVPAVWTNTQTRTPVGPDGCDQYGTTTMGKAITVHSIDFKQVSSTGSSISYEVESWTGEMGMDSDWEQLTGQLVLTLR